MRRVRVKLIKPGRRPFYVMRWVDPPTGEPREESTKTKNRRKAEEIGRDKEVALAAADPLAVDTQTAWAKFRKRYESEHLATLAGGTAKLWSTVVGYVEEIIRPQTVSDVTSSALSHYAAQRRKAGAKPSTVSKEMRVIRAAIGWGVPLGLARMRPHAAAAKRERGKQRLMRGRPINDTEFGLMLAAVDDVRGQAGDAEDWKDFLRGMYWGSLRLGEALSLSWDADAGFSLDLKSRRPRFKIFAEHQKGNRDEYCPVAPEFAELAAKTPTSMRHGLVYAVARRTAYNWAIKVIRAIGRKSGVLVDPRHGQYAGAQTLRKSFGTRWASRVKPATLKRMMRHKSIQTTMDYYADLDADEIGDEIAQWGENPAKKGA